MAEGHEKSDTAGLADPSDARSNCGVGVVMDLDGGNSHSVVADGLSLVECMEHRGTTGAEENTGDGAGIMLQIPHAFFSEELPFDLPAPGEYAVGSLFLPPEDGPREELVSFVEQQLTAEGLEVLGWRSVPTDNGSLGATALESEPTVQQVFVTDRTAETSDDPEDQSTDEAADAFDRRL
jgi:glutamate synthase (ferredoxin)